MQKVTQWGLFPYLLAFAAAVVLAAAIPTNTAQACEWLETGTISHHYDDTKGYQNVNPTVGCEINKVAVTYFINSYGWDTFMIDRSFQVAQIGRLEIGARAGIAKGYRHKIPTFSVLLDDQIEQMLGEEVQRVAEQVAPIVMPYLRWQIDENARTNCYILYASGVACSLSFRL